MHAEHRHSSLTSHFLPVQSAERFCPVFLKQGLPTPLLLHSVWCHGDGAGDSVGKGKRILFSLSRILGAAYLNPQTVLEGKEGAGLYPGAGAAQPAPAGRPAGRWCSGLSVSVLPAARGSWRELLPDGHRGPPAAQGSSRQLLRGERLFAVAPENAQRRRVQAAFGQGTCSQPHCDVWASAAGGRGAGGLCLPPSPPARLFAQSNSCP